MPYQHPISKAYNPPSSKPIPIKISQILKIEKLEYDIAQHINDINRFYSAIVSALTLPPILMTLLLHSSSPLHSVYKNYYEYQFHEHSQTTDGIFKDFHRINDEIVAEFEEIKKMLEKGAHSLNHIKK